MVKLGYKLMSEEHGPAELVRSARRAGEAGFDFAAISDHYFPGLQEQGHASFAWAVLGAIAQATRRMGLMTAVTCPIMRYHPGIIAQATATMGVLSDSRFTLGLGAGERLNEHVVGEGWAGVAERHERLEEAVDIIQALLAGRSSICMESISDATPQSSSTDRSASPKSSWPQAAPTPRSWPRKRPTA